MKALQDKRRREKREGAGRMEKMAKRGVKQRLGKRRKEERKRKRKRKRTRKE